jgi:Tail tubular protein
MGYLSKLNAVNLMLLASGESLVADLQEASGIDTGISEFILDQASLDHQLRGLVENKITRKVVLTVAGEILLGYPNTDYLGVLAASLVVPVQNTNGDLIQVRVQEGNPPRLWNMTDETPTFEIGEYWIETVNLLSWEQLDTVAQRSVLADAMRKYQMITQGDTNADRMLAEQVMIYKIKAKADNTANSNYNIFNLNQTASDAVNRISNSNPRLWNGGV